MKPILFNAEMVKAILEGRKTMVTITMEDNDKPEWRAGDILSVFDETKSIFKLENPHASTLTQYTHYVGNYFLKNDRFECRVKVTDVRVERLQDRSEMDCVKEGIEELISGRGFYDPTVSKGMIRLGHYCETATEAYSILWDETARQGYKWKDNPYVYVYEFERVKND